ncbi:MAG: NAD(P)/FAD-dependent oxidoreductase [Tepidiformaceae bacterium]
MSDPDVVVIGGGPGGSTAATMLARKGWSVRLFERERFPREHVGESLLPASIPILEELGAMPAIEAAGFLPKWGATMVWGASPDPWSWYFRETNIKHPHSFQVWRPQFDQILLENSRAHGVDVREGQRVVDVLFDHGRAAGVLMAVDGREETVPARFVVDASGQAGLLGRKLGLRRPDEQFRNLALYAYFEGAERLPAPDETNIFIESYSDGWAWVIPLHTGQASVGFVVDSKAGQAAIARAGVEAAYAEQVNRAPHASRMLRAATQAAPAKVIRDWSYVSEEVAGDGYVLVGDAACFIDTLFSTGVHLALSAGVLGAAYVTTALKDPGMREAAGRSYKDLYFQQYGLFRELARLFYATNRTVDTYFWEARRILNVDDSMTPRSAFIRAAAGQPPKGYERMVFEHGEAPPEFVEGISALEGERAARQQHIAAVPEAGRAAALLATIPVLAAGVSVERRAVLAEGEFAWGMVITEPGRADHVPVSPFVAQLVAAIDGQAPLDVLVERVTAGVESGAVARLKQVAARAVEILYVDSLVAELRGVAEQTEDA